MRSIAVRADYEDLENIARKLIQLSYDVQSTVVDLRMQMSVLQSGGWLGDAADAFYAEMDEVMFPHLKKLTDTYDDTAHGIDRVIDIFQQADGQIRPMFRSSGGTWQALTSALSSFVSGTGATGEGAGLAALVGIGGGSLTFSGLGNLPGGLPPSGGTFGPSSLASVNTLLQGHGITLPSAVITLMQGTFVEPGVAPLVMPTGLSGMESHLLGMPQFQLVLQTIYNNPSDAVGYFELAHLLDQSGFSGPAIQTYQAFLNLVNPTSWGYGDLQDAQSRLNQLLSAASG
jgi:WXG100 family type VII secretion target